MTAGAQPDTHGMVIVHRVFRRELRLLPELISKVADGNTERAAVLAEHLTDLVSALHHHHQGEDDLLWPRLLERATLHADLVHRMEAQHVALSSVLDRIDKLTPAWATTAGTAARDELATTVGEASALLDVHLDEEEQEILPLTREHLTVREWAEIGERGANSIQDKRKRLIFLGMILEDASPQEQRTFLAQLPPPVRILWKVAGKPMFGGYLRRIRVG